MNRRKSIFKNSAAGLVSQVSTILFTFLTRSLFIKYIGVELLGINSTFTSVLGTLALAELGFQSAITFSLYRPLHDGDLETVNDVMNIFNLVYRYVGIFFIAASVAAMPFLKYVVTGVEMSGEIYLYFSLQALASAMTYFLAYKRAIFYADQRDYVTKTVDLVTNIICNVLQCISIIIWKDYVLYLVLKIVQTVTANLIVHFYCIRVYPYLHSGKIKMEQFRAIWKNVKNVFAGRIASYIYSSTNNLVVSAFVSTVSVGYLVNYTTVTKSLRLLCTGVLNPIVPMIGNHLVDSADGEKRREFFDVYTHIRYLIAIFVVIPTFVLINDFIRLWVGADMVLAQGVAILLVIDFYIDIVHSASMDFINGAGLFREERNIEIIGALLNLAVSLILVFRYGIMGTLTGTVISQIFFWVGRSRVVFYKCLRQKNRDYWNYWMKNLIYAVAFVVGTGICMFLYKWIPVDRLLLRFMIGGILCEVILLVYVVLVFARCPEQKKIVHFLIGRCVKHRWNTIHERKMY